ncbi:MAG: hypothetical protein J5441_06130 [Clostridia bacterium]|nr:hypothetical protein [Clostridia bacterium]
MKKRIILSSVLAVSAVLALVTPQITKRAASIPTPPASTVSEVDGYFLREYNGLIGVFKPGISEPLTVVEVDTRTLPESDRLALIRGVYAADDDELNRRIEDFSS